jgi:predicted 3-demethylubiquinone-9 3-methyltransferase (glyoxalase superfamily)
MATIKKQKIIPYLWYDNQAKEAAEFYCSIFNNSRVYSVSDMIVEFELEGLKFIALNGGPKYTFNESVSFFVLCKDQQEVDYFWNNLIKDGCAESQCGWCKDKFGLSWQIVPERFMEMMESGTPEQTKKVIEVMMPMKKMILEDFEKAFKQ